jgi:hypothetical protein
MATVGFRIAAMIAALGQNGSIPIANTSLGGNPFSVHLLFGMTASMVLCGRGLAAYKDTLYPQRHVYEMFPRAVSLKLDI